MTLLASTRSCSSFTRTAPGNYNKPYNAWVGGTTSPLHTVRKPTESLNAQFASKGIHVSHIVIDGAVDAPDTLGKMLGPERFQALREKKGLENDGLLVPAEVANTYYHLAHQHRSAWTFELDLRAHSDLAWWNHASSPDLK